MLGLLRGCRKTRCAYSRLKLGQITLIPAGIPLSVCGVRNLDSFMLPPPVLNALFCEQMRQWADIAVIKRHGLYDGWRQSPIMPQHSRNGETAWLPGHPNTGGRQQLFQRRLRLPLLWDFSTSTRPSTSRA